MWGYSRKFVTGITKLVNLSPPPIAAASSAPLLAFTSSLTLPVRKLHVSPVLESRIKRRQTHKAFWHMKKTAKASDEPLTAKNRDFVARVIESEYKSGRDVLDDLASAHAQASPSSPLKAEFAPWTRGQWNGEGPNTRSGLIGRKIGVVPLWLKSGKAIPCTMVQIEENHVIKYLSPQDFAKTIMAEKRARPAVIRAKQPSNKLGCLVVGALDGDPTKFTKDYCGLFTSTGLMPKKKLARFPVTPNAIIQPGTPLTAAHFQPGQFVDVVGTSMRRGFMGVVKRWGFKGGRTRGNTKSHNRPGNIGSGLRNRVWPGKKLPGHKGGDKITFRGARVLRINYEDNVIYLHGGHFPGEVGDILQLFDSKMPDKQGGILRRFQGDYTPRFFPTAYPEDCDSLPLEEYYDKVHRFQDPTITFEEVEAGKRK